VKVQKFIVDAHSFLGRLNDSLPAEDYSLSKLTLVSYYICQNGYYNMDDSKDREQKISERLKCDTAKLNLSYYLYRKDLSDQVDSIVNLHSIRCFSNL
jgi:hypothetical protein